MVSLPTSSSDFVHSSDGNTFYREVYGTNVVLLQPRCRCGVPVIVQTAWTRQNPGRRSSTCLRDRGNDSGCGLWEWIDHAFPFQANNDINGLLSKRSQLMSATFELGRALCQKQAELDSLKQEYGEALGIVGKVQQKGVEKEQQGDAEKELHHENEQQTEAEKEQVDDAEKELLKRDKEVLTRRLKLHNVIAIFVAGLMVFVSFVMWLLMK